jgi:cyclohexanecarboxylate-CoA ligase
MNPMSMSMPVLDIENVLLSHPKVAEAALIGIPDEAVVERVCAVVVPAGEPLARTELVEYLRGEGVAKVFLPERLEVVAAMPRTATGKIRKVELRERYAGAEAVTPAAG